MEGEKIYLALLVVYNVVYTYENKYRCNAFGAELLELILC
jgi:hypothetical protein